MVTPDLDIIDSGVHFSPTARRASDHLPIWADIAPGDETRRTLGPPPPRLTWRARVSATLIRRERRIRG